MTKRDVDVIIDINEPGEITSAVDLHDEVRSYQLKELPAADLEISGVGFERKTPEDYVQSMMDDRLTQQTHKLGERYEHAYILLEGDIVETENPFKSSMKGESIRGSMASLIAREDSGVHGIIPCSNQGLLIDMAIRVSRKHVEEAGSEFVPKPSTGVDAPTTLMMYACIDGVGPEMAQTLYEEYPTISEFVYNADYDSLQQLDGIGEKTAIRIIEEMA